MADSSLTRPIELKKACDEAFTKFPISCSHAVMYVLKNRVSQTLPHRDANSLMDFLASPESKWVEVTEVRAQELADNGFVVVRRPQEDGW